MGAENKKTLDSGENDTDFDPICFELEGKIIECMIIEISGNKETIGKRLFIENKRYLIGRSEECDYPINNPSVSREHAEIRRDGRKVKIIDLNSTNGVYVNSRQIKKQKLVDGDRIQIGHVILKYISNNLEQKYFNEINDIKNRDPLTGFRNKSSFIETVGERLRKSNGSKSIVYLYLIEIDYMREIKEKYGQKNEDYIITNAAYKIEESLKYREDEVTMGRYGDAIFAVMIDTKKEKNDVSESNRLLDKFRKEKIEKGGMEIYLTISIGETRVERKVESPKDILDLTFRNLQKAKKLYGEDCVYRSSIGRVKEKKKNKGNENEWRLDISVTRKKKNSIALEEKSIFIPIYWLKRSLEEEKKNIGDEEKIEIGILKIKERDLLIPILGINIIRELEVLIGKKIGEVAGYGIRVSIEEGFFVFFRKTKEESLNEEKIGKIVENEIEKRMEEIGENRKQIKVLCQIRKFKDKKLEVEKVLEEIHLSLERKKDVERMPYPMARSYREVLVAPERGLKAMAAIGCIERTLRFYSLVSIAAMIQKIDEVGRKRKIIAEMEEVLFKNSTAGCELYMIKKAYKVSKNHRLPILSEIYKKYYTGRSEIKKLWRITKRTVELRNKFVHKNNVLLIEEMEEILEDFVDVFRPFWSANFVTSYRIEIDDKENIKMKCFEHAGSSSLFELKDIDVEKYRSKGTYLISKDRKEMIRLDPFISYAACTECKKMRLFWWKGVKEKERCVVQEGIFTEHRRKEKCYREKIGEIFGI